MRAQDVVPSIRRFAARDAFGRALMEATDELSAASDKVVQFRLKQPFPLLPNALGKTGTSMPCIMPERLAETDPNKQVTEMVGSGPFRFKADERVPGALVVYERNKRLRAAPRRLADLHRRAEDGALRPGRVARDPGRGDRRQCADQRRGGLVAGLDAGPARHAAQQAAASRPRCWIPAVRSAACASTSCFRRSTIRRSAARCWARSIRTRSWRRSPATIAALWKDHVGLFSPGTPMATTAGTDILVGKRDYAKVRDELQRAGYKGERVVLLDPTDYPNTHPLALVCADSLQKAGLNVDVAAIGLGHRGAAPRQPQAAGRGRLEPVRDRR